MWKLFNRWYDVKFLWCYLVDVCKNVMCEYEKMSGDFWDFEDIKCFLVDKFNKIILFDEEIGGKYGIVDSGIGEWLIIRGKLLKERRKIVDV